MTPCSKMGILRGMKATRANLADYTRHVRPLVRLGSFVPAPGQPAWDFDAPATDLALRALKADEAAASLSAWVEATQPPILFEHEERERSKGDPREEHGYVVGVLRLSESEARERGVESQSGDWLYAELACAPDLDRLISERRVRGVSPGLALGYEDDEGREWPVVLRELSFVAEPRLRTQPRAADVVSAALSDPGGRMARKLTKAVRARVRKHAASCTMKDSKGRLVGVGLAQLADAGDLEPGDVVVVSTEDGDPIATTTVEELTAVAEEIEAEAVVDEGEMGEPDEEMPMADVESRIARIEEMLAQIMGGQQAAMKDRAKPSEVAQLRDRLAYLETREAVRVELSDREIPAGGEEQLVRLRMQDAKAYTFTASLLPRRKAPASRVNLGDPAQPGATELDRARAVQAAEQIPFSEALLRVRREARA